MITRFFFISVFVAMVCLANGQTVVVNPDGTHTVVIDSKQTGTPTIIVHSNGQHTVVHTAGAHSVAVGPDGRHTIIVGTNQPRSPKIIVHPNGQHSVVHSTGGHSVVLHPDDTHTVVVHPLSRPLVNASVNTQAQMPVTLYIQRAVLLMLSCL